MRVIWFQTTQTKARMSFCAREREPAKPCCLASSPTVSRQRSLRSCSHQCRWELCCIRPLHLHGDNDLEPTIERIIAPNTWQLYLWSRLTNTVELISHHWDNRTSGNGDSIAPSISEDGLHIAFLSSSTDLVSGVNDANLQPDVYLYSRLEEKNTLVSRSKKDSSLTANRGTESPPQISRDGSTIAFLTSATDLTDLRDTNHDQICLHGMYRISE